jgi:hypothetical protein
MKQNRNEQVLALWSRVQVLELKRRRHAEDKAKRKELREALRQCEQERGVLEERTNQLELLVIALHQQLSQCAYTDSGAVCAYADSCVDRSYHVELSAEQHGCSEPRTLNIPREGCARNSQAQNGVADAGSHVHTSRGCVHKNAAMCREQEEDQDQHSHCCHATKTRSASDDEADDESGRTSDRNSLDDINGDATGGRVVNKTGVGSHSSTWSACSAHTQHGGGTMDVSRAPREKACSDERKIAKDKLEQLVTASAALKGYYTKEVEEACKREGKQETGSHRAGATGKQELERRSDATRGDTPATSAHQSGIDSESGRLQASASDSSSQDSEQDDSDSDSEASQSNKLTASGNTYSKRTSAYQRLKGVQVETDTGACAAGSGQQEHEALSTHENIGCESAVKCSSGCGAGGDTKDAGAGLHGSGRAAWREASEAAGREARDRTTRDGQTSEVSTTKPRVMREHDDGGDAEAANGTANVAMRYTCMCTHACMRMYCHPTFAFIKIEERI